MREVSRSRNMRSPDFSVGLGDGELTMVAVGKEGRTGGGVGESTRRDIRGVEC